MQSMERTQSFFSPLTFRQVFFWMLKKNTVSEKNQCARAGQQEEAWTPLRNKGLQEARINISEIWDPRCWPNVPWYLMFVIQSFQSLRSLGHLILSPRHSHGCKGHAPDLVHETSMDMGHGISRGMVHHKHIIIKYQKSRKKDKTN